MAWPPPLPPGRGWKKLGQGPEPGVEWAHGASVSTRATADNGTKVSGTAASVEVLQVRLTDSDGARVELKKNLAVQ